MVQHLRIVGLESATTMPYLLQIDEYVPIRFRTYHEQIGAVYLRLGNGSTQLLELIIAPRVGVVRGATATMVDTFSPWPAFEPLTISDASLPILAAKFDKRNYVDLPVPFQFAVRGNEALLFWADLEKCEMFTFNAMKWLARDGELVGLWFTELSTEQLAQLRTHER